MRNIKKIIGMIRTGEYPEAEIDRLITEEASTVVEQVVTSASPAGVRNRVVEYTRQVYADAADIVRREVRLRTKAALDAADAVARWQAQRDEAMALVREMIDPLKAVTDEQWAAVDKAPVFVARALNGGSSLEYALHVLAEREARTEELKAKVADR